MVQLCVVERTVVWVQVLKSSHAVCVPMELHKLVVLHRVVEHKHVQVVHGVRVITPLQMVKYVQIAIRARQTAHVLMAPVVVPIILLEAAGVRGLHVREELEVELVTIPPLSVEEHHVADLQHNPVEILSALLRAIAQVEVMRV